MQPRNPSTRCLCLSWLPTLAGLALITLLVAGCDDSQPPQPANDAANSVAQAAPSPAPAPAPAVPHPLDLQYRPEPLTGQENLEPLHDTTLLPDLITPPTDPNVSLSGKLLRDPEIEKPLESINGAEIHIEVKTR